MWTVTLTGRHFETCYDSRDCSHSLVKSKGRDHLGHWEGCKDLTKRCHKCKVLQHHTAVQEPLGLIKKHPLFLGEVNGHILKGQALWKCKQFIIWSASLSELQAHPVDPTHIICLLYFPSHIRGDTQLNAHSLLNDIVPFHRNGGDKHSWDLTSSPRMKATLPSCQCCGCHRYWLGREMVIEKIG